MTLFLNISGHELSEANESVVKAEGMKVITIPVKNITDPASERPTAEAVRESAREIMETLKKNKGVARAIKTGDFLLYGPGYGLLRDELLAALHGACGHFPKSVHVPRTKEGQFVLFLDETVDLQGTRLEYRDFFR